MTQIFPTPTASSSVKLETMQHLRTWLEANGPSYLLAALRTLETNTGGTPLATIPADLAWIDVHFPKVSRGKHPRPDLTQHLEPYKKWRADLVRAVKTATGATQEKAQRQARRDGWSELFTAARLHTQDPGFIHPASLAPFSALADIGRRVEIEPWNLADPDVLYRLEQGFTTPQDRRVLRRAQKFLKKFAFIAEFADLLPKEPICVFPTSRQYDALPAHIDAVLVEMAHIAGSERDLVAGKDSETIKDVTRAHYLSALRHHIRLLTQCPAEPAQGYDNPVEDLMTVNDVAGLFSIDHLKATIRQTQAVEHLQGTIRQVSAYDYYSEILVVLSRNGIDTAEIYKTFKSSVFLRQGKDLGRGMTEASKVWCASLMNTPDRERRFTNMHRILMAQAEKIFSHAADEGRPLLSKERTQIRKLGVCAATSAIEWAGRPIRLSNVLELRLRGSRRNFFTPTKAQPDYAFHLFADETKAGKSGERTALRKELYGPQVLAWYLRKVRPLFEHADDNLYLFPAVTTPGKRLGNGLFDTWFQSAASSAGLPMSFHRWRHGYATLLLASDWNNLQLAADMLGNTVPVCAQKYAWLDKPKLIKAGQDELIKRMRALK